MSQIGIYFALGLLALLILLALRGPIFTCIKLLTRSIFSFLILLVLNPLISGLGISLGANFLNAFVLGCLGFSGFGLLLMTNWVFCY